MRKSRKLTSLVADTASGSPRSDASVCGRNHPGPRGDVAAPMSTGAGAAPEKETVSGPLKAPELLTNALTASVQLVCACLAVTWRFYGETKAHDGQIASGQSSTGGYKGEVTEPKQRMGVRHAHQTVSTVTNSVSFSYWRTRPGEAMASGLSFKKLRPTLNEAGIICQSGKKKATMLNHSSVNRATG